MHEAILLRSLAFYWTINTTYSPLNIDLTNKESRLTEHNQQKPNYSLYLGLNPQLIDSNTVALPTAQPMRGIPQALFIVFKPVQKINDFHLSRDSASPSGQGPPACQKGKEREEGTIHCNHLLTGHTSRLIQTVSKAPGPGRTPRFASPSSPEHIRPSSLCFPYH